MSRRLDLIALTERVFSGERGAGDGPRTRDPQLGKLMLYQLSYSREAEAIGLRREIIPSRATLPQGAVNPCANRRASAAL